MLAYPDARLTFVNRDSLPDLFVTISWENNVSGYLYLGGATVPRLIFRSGNQACDVPELRDVTGDGLVDILDLQAGALKPEVCTADLDVVVCYAEYPVNWIDVWVQEGGSFVRGSNKASGFYLSLSEKYASAAADLRESIRNREGPSAKSPRCNAKMAATFESLAVRADSLSKLP